MADPFLGEVRMFGGNFAPVGWMFCNGQLLAIADNEALYSLLGTTYGGDGQTTFALPDLRGRTPIHMGQGPGLTSRTLGEMTGTESVTLTPQQIPAHYHAVHAVSAGGTVGDPTGAAWASGSTGEKQYTQNAPNAAMSANCTTTAGNSFPHDNMAPYQAISYIIAVEGIYPTQN